MTYYVGGQADCGGEGRSLWVAQADLASLGLFAEYANRSGADAVQSQQIVLVGSEQLF